MKLRHVALASVLALASCGWSGSDGQGGATKGINVTQEEGQTIGSIIGGLIFGPAGAAAGGVLGGIAVMALGGKKAATKPADATPPPAAS